MFIVHEFVTNNTLDEHYVRNAQDLNTFLRRFTAGTVTAIPADKLIGPFRVPGSVHNPSAIPLYVGNVSRQTLRPRLRDSRGRSGEIGISCDSKRERIEVKSKRQLRMAERGEDLAANFGWYLREFETRTVFGGPSVHFHVRAIERRVSHQDVRSAIEDAELIELIYAVLASWGMHRMGPKGAKLASFAEFREGVRRQAEILADLQPLLITGVADVNGVADQIWRAVSDARLSASGTQIVAGTKALHHLLPSLIPPVDREYTIRFFHGSKGMHMGDERAFKEAFPAFAAIASRVTADLKVNDRSPMNTSPTKIVDNAIVGYVWSRLKSATDVGPNAPGT